jgi:Fungal specific transcription factor domain
VTKPQLIRYKVTDNFGDTKDQFLVRLMLGTEQSLLRAGVFNTTDLSVVQAFTIYLEFVGQPYGTRAIWIMASLLVRTAVSMGLHRDGSHFPNVSHFETEMRRRLWWHICFIDSRVSACEVSEDSISESIFDTQEPTNLNDADIEPNMSDEPVAREGYTDMSPCLLHCELWRLGCRVESSMSALHTGKNAASQTLKQRLELLEQSRDKSRKNFLKYLVPDKPIHSFIESVACLALTRYELVIRHVDIFRETTNGSNDSQGQKSFLTAIACLEHMQELEIRPSTQQWGWIFHGCVPWHAIGVILVQLCMRPWGPTCERAWTTVQKTFNNIPEATRKKSLRHPVHSLMATVRRHREEEIQRLRAQPIISRQLNQLVTIHHAVPQGLNPLASRTAFDTLAAEERLILETAVSTGMVRQSLCSTDLGPTSDMDMTLDWVNTWTDIGSTPRRIGSSAFPPAIAGPAEEAARTTSLTSQTAQAPFDSDLTACGGADSGLNAESGHDIYPLFSSREAGNGDGELQIPITPDDHMNWLVCREIFERGDGPW